MSVFRCLIYIHILCSYSIKHKAEFVSKTTHFKNELWPSIHATRAKSDTVRTRRIEGEAANEDRKNLGTIKKR